MGPIKFFITTLLLATAFVLFPFKSVADSNLALRMGSGIANTEKSAIYSIGYEETFVDHFLYKIDAGAWTDNQPERNGAPYGSVGLGPRLGSLKGFNLQIVGSVAIAGYTDSLLGSNFQFTEELTLGYGPVGFGYKHFSNAGIIRPNIGRDYVYLNLALPLF